MRLFGKLAHAHPALVGLSEHAQPQQRQVRLDETLLIDPGPAMPRPNAAQLAQGVAKWWSHVRLEYFFNQVGSGQF